MVDYFGSGRAHFGEYGKKRIFPLVYSVFRYVRHTNEVKQNDNPFRLRFGDVYVSIRFDADAL